MHAREKIETAPASAGSGKKEKGNTYRDTLDLLLQGKSADEIAAMRRLSLSMIKGHLARWVGRGDIDIHSLLPAETVDSVLAYLRENEGATVSAIRSGTGDRFDYGDIRMVVAHHLRVESVGGNSGC